MSVVEGLQSSRYKQCVLILMFLLVLVISFGIWLMLQFGGTMGDLECIVNGYDKCQAHGGTLKQASDQIPKDAIDMIKQVTPLLPVLVITPAVLVLVTMVIASVCIWFRADSANSMVCTKFVLCMNMLICLVGFILYAIVGAIAYTIEEGELKEDVEVWEAQFRDVCDTYINGQLATDIQHYLNLTLTMTTTLGLDGSMTYGGMSVDEAQQYARDANAAIKIFQDLCACLYDIFDNLKSLKVPALGSAVLMLLAFMSTCRVCCLLGCCCKPKAVKQVHPAPAKKVQG